ncbi:class 1 fructose-bisphosphatase [Muricauda ruestringensis]|uniref:class 1 fructose-bisphosphatase n=1 Tax=Flagellimonas ruestringensis TaxID=111501 RepID=UPI001CD3AEE4|nr:class 1 fructose-bisphosphatase [Allomuricauda ruestringensis]MCA0957653.1 class 1 fructose-bisphosphatase [Allomuricauda ruestringensis]
MERPITLGEFIIENQKDFAYAKGELTALLSSIKLAGKVVNEKINKAGLSSIIGKIGTENVQGEIQAKLDIIANDVFVDTLRNRGEICGLASEEFENFISFDEAINLESKYVVLIDPLDGSSNIDVNVTVGTIFSIYRRLSPVGSPVTLEDFLQPGINQIAAGYLIYGSSTILVYTVGNGVNGFTFNPGIGSFFLSHPNIRFPDTAKIYSMNEGNYEHFPTGIKKFIKWAQHIDDSQNTPLTARYTGSLVADIHRNMLLGGIYLYPQGTLSPNGKLRLLYEANPIAFITEQAGGRAVDGKNRILEILPKELHQRSPLICGSKKLVERVENFIDKFSEGY